MMQLLDSMHGHAYAWHIQQPWAQGTAFAAQLWLKHSRQQSIHDDEQVRACIQAGTSALCISGIGQEM